MLYWYSVSGETIRRGPMQTKPADLQVRLLSFLHIPMLVILLVSLLAVNLPLSYAPVDQTLYTILISLLIIILLCSMFLLGKNHYMLALILTILIPLIGSWGSTYINFQAGAYEYLPLIYGAIPIMLASFFLPLSAAVALMAFQLVALMIVFSNTAALRLQNWPSFYIFFLFLCMLSLIANTLINKQLQQLKELTVRDHLTGLFNRRYFEETLENKLKRTNTETRTLGLIYFDIDRFKNVNDTHGHEAGDVVLKAIASLLVEYFDLATTISRYGGDEFAILVLQVSLKQLSMLAHGLVKQVEALSVTHKNQAITTISISAGYLVTNATYNRPELLFEHADEALYQAKKAGRNCAVGYEEVQTSS